MECCVVCQLEVDLFESLSFLLNIISNQRGGIEVYTKGEIVRASKRQHPKLVLQKISEPYIIIHYTSHYTILLTSFCLLILILCTCQLYYIPFRFLQIFTMYLWVGEGGLEQGGGGLERGGQNANCMGTVSVLTVPAIF